MKKIVILALTIMLSACGNATLDKHKDTFPELKLEQFFDGELVAYGMVLDRSGNLLRRFEVKLLASWQGDTGEIKEWFEFDDGEKSTRNWQLKNIGNNQYEGTAEDVVGTATGRTEGAALYWQYDLEIPVDGTTYQVTLDDWMFLIDEKRLFNKTDMSKWGINVGEIILYIEKK
ncbi:DUF3833 domain-containing protein [Vibrio genomosp. F10 str. 9ZC157]|uniref:DUF3833 domain-containing protein n=2 Tax=Vibrio genomosp. F10 TaxID=723171 RepID=A0A1E5BA26_9VIBR|nr:DUF3833 domain-containing protein [Vibrio genomosp. F10]OEE30767.1 hypothetical protein A1QO_15665 [Vibrio genomosp. F10 str. ZF-129]OEE94018.1 hypothetical protein A1QM_07575 [Vibrio genomosp. F10 str. 9ZC157]